MTRQSCLRSGCQPPHLPLRSTAFDNQLVLDQATPAHQCVYFDSQMGRRRRKARKREIEDQPGRGFPHHGEDSAHEAVNLATDLAGHTLAIGVGSQLTCYSQGCAEAAALQPLLLGKL